MNSAFKANCMDCERFGISCFDMIGTEPAGGCFISHYEVQKMKLHLTKTQYNYWYDYYVENMTLADISIKYDKHITTVCKVLKNARKRLETVYGKAG